ncbi:MAG: hypothetical protein HC801_13470, partial [Nitrospira sp.]|nr:hypothetical protein [Nitrospira sp.]
LMASDSAGNPTVRVVDGGMIDIEYHRDVLPIFQRRCVGCHNSTNNPSRTGLAFDGTTEANHPWSVLCKDYSGRFGGPPQKKFLEP